jgi:3-methyladenine DNA glycosylase AlkD
MVNPSELRSEIKSKFEPIRAEHSKRFFKTGKGEYGEGDVFYGLSVPEIRTLAKKYFDLNLDDLQELLKSKIHEERLCALIIMVLRTKKANEYIKKDLCDMYLRNYNNINNWDLVDLSAPNVVGKYLINKDRKVLFEFAKSGNLWKKRIAIISTFWFIRNNDFKDTLKISEILLNDKHDLIHKAVGWALREVGKKDLKIEEDFLKKHYKKMPRTMLRYAIERFEEKKRLEYLNGTI